MKDIFKNLNIETKTILNMLCLNGPLTKDELVNILEMKLTTFNRFFQLLIDNNLVSQVGYDVSSGGRKPLLYDATLEKHHMIGIDISRLYVNVVVTNLKFKVIYQQKIEMNSEISPQIAVEKINIIIKEFYTSTKVDKNELIAIGCGTVGPIDIENGIMLNPGKFPSDEWGRVEIREMLRKSLGSTIFIDNGANTAALAEYYIGAGKECANLAYFHCGIGIRTGFISKDKIIRGINDAEDAFAHMVIDFIGEKCRCGNYGCIETFASIDSIIKAFLKELKRGRKTVLDKNFKDISYIDIANAAGKGDSICIEVIEKAASAFGTGLANFINILNPDAVIISGPLIKYSDIYFNIAIEIAKERMYRQSKKNIEFYKDGLLKENAIAIGAALFAFEKTIDIKEL